MHLQNIRDMLSFNSRENLCQKSFSTVMTAKNYKLSWEQLLSLFDLLSRKSVAQVLLFSNSLALQMGWGIFPTSVSQTERSFLFHFSVLCWPAWLSLKLEIPAIILMLSGVAKLGDFFLGGHDLTMWMNMIVS